MPMSLQTGPKQELLPTGKCHKEKKKKKKVPAGLNKKEKKNDIPERKK